MNDYIEVSAKTVEDAITEARIQLNITSDMMDMLEYEVIEAGSKGFLGFGSKKAVIRARKKIKEKPERFEKKNFKKEKPVKKEHFNKQNVSAVKEEKQEKPVKVEAPKTSEKPAKKEKPPIKNNTIGEKTEIKKSIVKVAVVEQKEVEKVEVKNKEELIKAADDFLKDVFGAMQMKVERKIYFDNNENSIEIELSGDDMGVLIGKRGHTLDSIQYLTSLVVNKLSDGYIRVKIDTENYRARRKEILEKLANNMASKARRTRRPVSIEPMNPYERRIIHSTLQTNPYVETYSEGAEPYRKVIIAPKRRNK